MSAELELIEADWSAPANVKAVVTTRRGGVSEGDYASLNMATHVDDDPALVMHNRQLVAGSCDYTTEPHWLNQVHGNRVAAAGSDVFDADACWTDQPGKVCAVLTADCLPVFVCDRQGSQVAVAHAGWRGLHAGVITETVRCFRQSADRLLVWLGPAIGPQAFEVGEEVYDAFTTKSSRNDNAFIAREDASAGKYLCDIYQLARNELHAAGVEQVSGGDYCTWTDSERFYSFRRNAKTGRMASLVWLL